jgi:hypothetical protein
VDGLRAGGVVVKDCDPAAYAAVSLTNQGSSIRLDPWRRPPAGDVWPIVLMVGHWVISASV